jgi:ribonuclease-3
MHESDAIEGLARHLGLLDVDLDLLRQALQHPSYVRESDDAAVKSNQRLEFLGDGVLDLVLADYLFRHDPTLTEGTLTKLKSSLVREDSLARIGRELGLGEFILLGRGEADTGGRAKGSLIADTLEAIIAVAYLSGGLEAAREFVLTHFAAGIHDALAHGPHEDPKTTLQELLQQRAKRGPDYLTVPDEGPPHEPLFRSECRFRGQVIGVGRGRTKREAEKQAAADALTQIDELGLDGGAETTGLGPQTADLGLQPGDGEPQGARSEVAPASVGEDPLIPPTAGS